jgi:SNF2 family DNA or RNA helicase
VAPPVPQPKVLGVDVTFLANAGFLLQSGRYSVLIDAFLREPTDIYAALPDDIYKQLVNAQPPFDKLMIVMVSHRHPDHVQMRGLEKYLGKNNQAQLMTSPEVLLALKEHARDFPAIQRRLSSIPTVPGVINKLETYSGCILADSVGLGKTFTALAVIKYYELRNRSVLVLCPKKLADNWLTYRGNLVTNIFAKDRFGYDVLCHTDLLRESGTSISGMPLNRVNWGNYDLVVIDESHNFRNKKTPRVGSETRYDRLMRKIIKEGVKTRVLMLSATPVNNRLADLRNQISFATEGDDTALLDHGITSIDATAADMLRELFGDLEQRGVTLAFAELKGHVRERLERYGLVDLVGLDHFYRTIGEVVKAYVAAEQVAWTDWEDREQGEP